MNFPHPYLQPYKGKDTRHDCPSCKAKLSFTLYLDGNTHKPIHDIVGKCNRESKCGYHYTPKQYFLDNPMSQSSSSSYKIVPNIQTPSPQGGQVGLIPFSFVERSSSYKSNFVRFLFDYFSDEQIRSVAEKYALGATKSREVIFWQIDTTGKVRTGKIMQYNATTGRRIKHESGAIDWVHNKLKKSGYLPEDFNLQQCLFGEHLLKIYPTKHVAIVESEKSAIIASCIMPELVWLAAGNLNGLSVEKCKVLKGRSVMLYPDLGAFEKWSKKAQMLNLLLPLSLSPSPFGEGTNGQRPKELIRVSCSTLLEDESTDTDRANGLDIADFIIAELKSPLSSGRGVRSEALPEIQTFFSPALQSMIERSNALLILINKLGLEEI